MENFFATAFWLVIVGIVWGCTNPLMKYGSKGVTDLPKKSNPVLQVLSELLFLFTNYKYIIPFLINMSGSVIFYWTLSSMELSLVVPITNSLTFLFTTLTSRLLGEKQLNAYGYLGMVFVIIGVSICVQSKV